MRRSLSLALSVILVVLVAPAMAIAQDPRPPLSRAEMDPSQETGPVASDATGVATTQEVDDGFLVQVIVHDLAGVAAAHIHCGPAGEDGPVGLTLFAGDPADVDGRLVLDLFTEPDEGNDCEWASLDDVAEAILNGDAYVNVHTTAYPAGEIRGQLEDVEVAPDRFTDTAGNVHAANIDLIAAAGITLGCNPPDNDEFCPSDDITRGQMAAFLVRALNLTPLSEGPFTDTAESVFEMDINAISAAGITQGCNPPDNDEFCPNDPVRRDEMASFLAAALGLSPTGEAPFTDIAGNVHEGRIIAIYDDGITRGCTETLYCPADNVRRDEMASFLARAIWGQASSVA